MRENDERSARPQEMGQPRPVERASCTAASTTARAGFRCRSSTESRSSETRSRSRSCARRSRASKTTSASRSAPRPRRRARLARRLFFEYGKSTIDVWRLRSEAFVSEDHDVRRGRRDARAGPAGRPRFPSRDGARRQLGDGRRDAARARADPGRRRPAGARPARPRNAPAACGGASASSRSTSARRWRRRSRCATAVENGRAVALLVDRAYPEDRVVVPYFGRADAVPALAGAPRPILRLRDPARLLPAQPGRLLPQRLGNADSRRRVASRPTRTRGAS